MTLHNDQLIHQNSEKDSVNEFIYVSGYRIYTYRFRPKNGIIQFETHYKSLNGFINIDLLMICC